MKKIIKDRPYEQRQRLIFIGISVIAGFMVGFLYGFAPFIFQAFLGYFNPLLAIFFIILLGVVASAFLLSRDWFSIYDREQPRGPLFAGGLAVLFAIVVILFDLRIVFPEDTNVSFPLSLLFYPAMGYVVEVLFHLAPLALLLTILTRLFPRASFEKMIWFCLVIVATLEPTFQLRFFLPLAPPLWSVIFLWVHLFLFNLTQLYLFRRYDFLSMYTFRLVYYLLWHIAWGQLRLDLLF